MLFHHALCQLLLLYVDYTDEAAGPVERSRALMNSV
jgi:hypothetical protein